MFQLYYLIGKNAKILIQGFIVFCLLLSTSSYAQNQCASFGWANYDGQTAKGTPTGGGNATPIQVTTFSQLKSALESSDPKVIYVMNDMGAGYKGTSGDVLNVKSNKTVIGFKPGITVKCSWQIKNVSNIIVKNLICRGPGNSNSQQNWDCVNIQGSKRIWFDHCTVMEGEDGNFDVVKGSDNVTVTWCKFYYVTGGSHNLSNLVGSSDNESVSHGKLNITYAYCWWDNVNSRCPRTRYGKIHVLNSYYNNVGSGAYAGFMSNVRVEGCFFESNVSNPTGLISTGGQAGVFAIDCNRGSTKTDGYNTAFTPPYQYKKYANSEVKALVTNPNCGAGPTLDSPTDCGCDSGPQKDCAGVENGTASVDQCGVCSGGTTGKTPNATCKDCNGVPNGGAQIDNCGVCTGGNTGKTACVKDCNGVEGGTAYKDDCDICVGGTTGKNPCVVDCNGDVNGTASVDNCGVCTGGNSVNKPCTESLEAEEACTLDGSVDNDNAGFSGSGFANTDNVMGASASWKVTSTSAQTATITFTYANGGTTDRKGDLYITGSKVATVSLLPTGSWTTWRTSTVNVSLSPGLNILELKATTSDGLANLDILHFSEGVSMANCLVTGVEVLDGVDINVYPNPTNREVQWDYIAKWQLLDAKGIELKSGEGVMTDLSSYAAGTYFLKVDEKLVKVVKE